MLRDKRAQSRRRLDQRFDRHGDLADLAPPPQGWIRTLREALGMSGGDLARRMGVHPSRISAIERGEREQTLKLDTLTRVADAMQCELVYALIPRTSLDGIVADQSRRRAVRHLRNVIAHSRLEDQEVTPDDLEAQIEDVAFEFRSRRDLWRTD
ncbi:MAG: mobile mystery protein A [Acidimicrobiales bacterium]|nr:mobile mystery protein A [Acidimicrobiales bacterium]MYH74770.1 mobile mystery protein A [Acidimicrobiales bacterium]MYK71212.1 mobile mystery protein A [Acidimicrobiales bacterium]